MPVTILPLPLVMWRAERETGGYETQLVQMAVEASARRIGGDTTYIMSLYERSPRVLKRLGAAIEMLSHREAVPIEAA
jgi:hypothetical protein